MPFYERNIWGHVVILWPSFRLLQSSSSDLVRQDLTIIFVLFISLSIWLTFLIWTLLMVEKANQSVAFSMQDLLKYFVDASCPF